jgi:hypothetical protein
MLSRIKKGENEVKYVAKNGLNAGFKLWKTVEGCNERSRSRCTNVGEIRKQSCGVARLNTLSRVAG